MTDLDSLVLPPPAPESARSTVSGRKPPHRHRWGVPYAKDDDYTERCLACDKAKDAILSRRGRQSRNYGNRAELDVARRYGGEKVGHHGGPVDVRGTDFATQVKTYRRKPPIGWTTALASMDGSQRCPRMLLRFVFPGGPADFIVFRGSDFIDWFGRDE